MPWGEIFSRPGSGQVVSSDSFFNSALLLPLSDRLWMPVLITFCFKNHLITSAHRQLVFCNLTHIVAVKELRRQGIDR